MPKRDDDFSLDDFDLDDGDTKVNVAADATDEELAEFDAAADSGDDDLLGLTDEEEAPPPKRATAKSSAKSATATKSLSPAKAVTTKVSSESQDAVPPNRLVNLTADVPVQLVAVLGKKSLVLHDLLDVKSGDVLEFSTPLTTTVDLVANGKLFARGELVEIEGTMGVRIVQLLK